MTDTAAKTQATPREMAIIAARAADEKKATDIIVQEVGDLIGVTEYFVIVTAANNRQVGAIIDEVEEAEREFYRLEALWNDAPVMDLAAEAGITDAVYSDRVAAMLENRETMLADLEENRVPEDLEA